MECNLISYNKDNFPVFRYSKLTDTLYFYKYSMNYKKRESVAISILHEEIHVNFKKEIGDPEQKWNNGLKTEISFMPNQILFSKENKHKGTLKKLKYNLEKDSFIGQTSYKKNNVELGLENHNGNLNWIFKTSEELISKFKNILKNG